eukprot:7381530-Prymnesium_polylepis.2
MRASAAHDRVLGGIQSGILGTLRVVSAVAGERSGCPAAHFGMLLLAPAAEEFAAGEVVDSGRLVPSQVVVRQPMCRSG